MSVEDNKAVVQRIIDEAFNQGRLEVVDQVVDSSCGYRLVGSREQSRQIGPRLVREIIQLFRTAFPDLHIEIEDQIVKGNQVVTCWCARGTHLGNLLGLAATGRRVSVTGIAITRIVSSRLVDYWGHFDALGMIQQLGMLPTMDGATSGDQVSTLLQARQVG